MSKGRSGLKAPMNTSMSRRHVLAAPLALAGCVAAGPYFGKTTPPGSQRLVHSNLGEATKLPGSGAVSRSRQRCRRGGVIGFPDKCLAPLLTSLRRLWLRIMRSITRTLDTPSFCEDTLSLAAFDSRTRIRCLGSSAVGARRRRIERLRAGATTRSLPLMISCIRGVGSSIQ